MPSALRYRSASWFGGFLAVIAAIGSSVLYAKDIHATASAERAASALTTAELTAFVGVLGWPADLGRLCKAFKLERHGDDCQFSQVAFQTPETELDLHGFNLLLEPSTPSYVVVFHLRPLLGKFFLASADGHFIAALIRTTELDYSAIADEHAALEFEEELALWRASLNQIAQELNSGNGPTFTPPIPTRP
jgi:hypothetical protein